MAEIDYYKILGLTEDASQKKIKEAYRKLAFEYHPDRNRGNSESTARMKAINEAYAVLSHPAKRSSYDAMRKQFGSSAYGHFRQSFSEDDIFRGSDINQIFEQMSRIFGLRGFEDVFQESYGRGYRSFEFKRPGFFARGFVFTGPGGMRGSPQASARIKGPFGTLSRYLLGKMTGIELPQDGENVTEMILLTPSEAKEGGPYPYFYRKKSKKLVVIVPAGMREGQRIRLVGMGNEGKGGGKPGDLYLKVRVKKPWMERVKGLFYGLGKQSKHPRP